MRACPVVSLLIALLLPLSAMAQAPSPVGTWQQVDDDSGKVTSVIRITQTDNGLQGTVLKVMNMTPEQIARDGNPPKCTQCEGKRHNQPIEGMAIMWGVQKDGDEWNGGEILDPNSGKTYKVKLELEEGGQKLDVRGYMGWSLFGRTQVWNRAPEAPPPPHLLPMPPPPQVNTAEPAMPASAPMPATPSSAGMP